MPTLYVREVPAKVYGQVQRIAQEQGRSLSAYVITVLEQAVEDEKDRRRSSEALARIRQCCRPLPEGLPDSVALLRKMRGYDE